jgi:NAD(P)-dependent dehydrogenase (short-subunit alcohol dehydrogenase family)
MSSTQQIVLVTGASSGIGKAIAEFLAGKGYYVFASARTMIKLEAMRSKNLEPLQLDVTDGDAVRAAVDHIQATKGRLDILINNAGYGIYGTVEGLTQEQVRRAFDVNVFGLGQVTQAVLPLMREQRSGTIVNMSSVVGKVSMPVLGWYAATKHAVEGLTDALRLEVKPFGIKVVMIEPGSIVTGFEDTAMATLAECDDPECYTDVRNGFSKVIRSGYESAPGPQVVVDAVYKAITARNPRARYTAGRDAAMFVAMKGLLSDGLFDRVVASQLN